MQARGEYRANNAEPSDVKSPQRPRKQAFTADLAPAVRLPSISEVGSGPRGRMTASSLTSGVNLRFLFANSSRKQHDDAAISSASPLERPKCEVVSPIGSKLLQTTAGSPQKRANKLRSDTRHSSLPSRRRKAGLVVK